MPRSFRFGAQLAWPSAPLDWSATARRVEDLGYSVLTVPDHLGDQLAPFPALAWAAAVTTRLRVGTLVLGNDFRHPALMARDAATLDRLSGGRLELGLGAGWLRSDYDHTGVPFDPPATRIARLAEAVPIVKAVLAGERVAHAGRHYRADGHLAPAPVGGHRPPILLGGGGRRMLTLAGREADIVNVNYDLGAGELRPDLAARGTAAHTRERLRWVREAAAGRADGVDPELAVSVYATIVTDDRHGTAAGFGAVVGLSADDILASPYFLIGSHAEITDDLGRRRDELGFSYVILGGNGWEALAPVVERLAGT